MSFILDALRKSDAERQRATTPGLADVRYAAPRARRNIWLPILVLVLVANGIFMAAQWFRGQGEPAESAANQPAPVAQPPAADDVEPAGIRPLARESEYGEPQFEPPFDMPPEMERGMPVSQPAIPPALMPAPDPAPAASETPARPSRIVSGNQLPTAEQLIGAGTLNIPLLNLDLHVYSDQPASRFVVINTRKYKEGTQLTEGPTVESIDNDGVTLSSQGQRFTLPRK